MPGNRNPVDRNPVDRNPVDRNPVDRNPVDRASAALFEIAVVVLLVSLLFGCKSSEYLSVREQPYSPLEQPLQLADAPQPTARTQQLLRQYDLTDDPENALIALQQYAQEEPAPDKVYALAELAYLAGKDAEGRRDEAGALDYYGVSVAYAYQYLFGEAFDNLRNPYDPQFRLACDLYNGALESAMRIVQRNGGLHAGRRQQISTGNMKFDVEVVVRGNWKAEEIDHFKFCSDYAVLGLANHYHTFGLGVPLIAVRKPISKDDPRERYYPPGLTFPVTAFLRVCPRDREDLSQGTFCRLELLDPLAGSEIVVSGRRVPLETNLSTPLAYFLNQPEFQGNQIATLGLLDPNQGHEFQGLYMLEPYDPAKVPVLMVHGLWSSPITWMEMFNDLRADPKLRDNYQFWFYLYPTGQPFWLSAATLRDDLNEARSTFDPYHRSIAMDQMVLVGHSMGGLVSRLQTYDSGLDYWQLVSDRPPEELQGETENRRSLERQLLFEPNYAVRRVITMGTPHRGSDFANDATRWLSRKLIISPRFAGDFQELVSDNPGYFRDTELLTISTSIDSLAPDSPVFPVMLKSPRAPWVKYHTVIGDVASQGLLGRVAGGSDGVVEYESARMEDAESEVIVPADHVNIHRHPRAILEVRRVLLDHLAQIRHEYLTGTDPRRRIFPSQRRELMADESRDLMADESRDLMADESRDLMADESRDLMQVHFHRHDPPATPPKP